MKHIVLILMLFPTLALTQNHGKKAEKDSKVAMVEVTDKLKLETEFFKCWKENVGDTLSATAKDYWRNQCRKSAETRAKYKVKHVEHKGTYFNCDSVKLKKLKKLCDQYTPDDVDSR